MIRPELGTVLVCLHRGSSAIGRLIRWQTRSEYSHASIILPDGRHAEAREFKGVIMHAEFTQMPGEEVEFFSVPVTPTQVDDITTFILTELGSPYDYVMVWHFVTRRGAVRASDVRWFCSEFVFAGFQRVGVDLLRATEAWEVSPGLLGRSPLLRFFCRIRRPQFLP